MCTIVFRFNLEIENSFSFFPGTFYLAANRDEFYERSARPMHWWKEPNPFLAGRDEQGGGSWLGISKDGRFAALTNFKEILKNKGGLKSRGNLVSDFLGNKNLSAKAFLKEIKKEEYPGFNLLLLDSNGVHYFSNRGKKNEYIKEGTHALGNILLNSNTPKINKAKSEFNALMTKPFIEENNLINFMKSDSGDLSNHNKKRFLETEDKEIPYRFIKSNVYGTRCTTLFSIDQKGLYKITELTYTRRGKEKEKVSFEFKPKRAIKV